MISFVGPLHGFHHYLIESSFLDRSYCPKFFRELFRSTKSLLAQLEHCWKALTNFTKAFTNSGIYCGNVSSPQLLIHMFLLISHQHGPSEAKLLGTHWHHACWRQHPETTSLFYPNNFTQKNNLIIYMFQCYSLRSSHPRLLPQSPKVCYILLCLLFCPTYRVIVTIFLNSIYMCQYTVLEFIFLVYFTLYNGLQFHPSHQN